LKNKDNLLPLSANQQILVAGDGANNIGKQSGGWTITWQGTNNFNEDFPGGSSIYDGIKQQVTAQGGNVELDVDGNYQIRPDVAIVVFGEEPYAEGVGDLENLEYQQGVKQDLALLKRLKADGIQVVSLFISGRPMWVNAELNASDAFVAVWLPGSEGVAVADVLFSNSNGSTNYDFTGKLSYSWPSSADQTNVNRFDDDYQPLLPYGFGLSYDDVNILPDDLEVMNVKASESLQSITLFESSIKAPWKVMISDADSSSIMTSSVIENKAVYVRTIDRSVQEDARRAIFNGKENGKIAFISNYATDLTQYNKANSRLEFTVRLTELNQLSEQQGLYLSMTCGESCQGKVNITKQLSLFEVNQWQTLSIDLQCFENAGANVSKITSPFSLTTSTQLTIDFTNVYIRPNKVDKALITCQ